MSNQIANGNCSIQRLPDGSWSGTIVSGYSNDGKQNLVSFSAKTKAELLQQIRRHQYEYENDLALALLQDNTFSAWADKWYADHRTQVQPSTYGGYIYTLKLIKAAFGEKKIDTIRPQDINQYLNSLYFSGCSYSKINKCRAMLIQVFDFAEGNDAVGKNPARFAKTIRNHDSFETSKDAFTEKEVALLLANLPDTKLGHSIRALLGSGMRVQELLALKPEDIADDGSMIRIRRAVKMVDGKAELGPPKSKSGVRDIPIPHAYRPSLLFLKAHSGKDYVWSSGRGNMLYCVGTFRKWYYRAIEEIGHIRRLPPHCCRHTYVSRLEEKGVPMEKIARLVGHSKITTTDVYLHVRAEALQNAVEVLNEQPNHTPVVADLLFDSAS